MRAAHISAWAGAAMVAALPALAQPPLAAAGLWTAYSAGDTTMPVCGIATAGAEGRRIAIEQQRGQNGLTLRFERPSWSIPDGTAVDIAIAIDRVPGLTVRATGSGPALAAGLGFDDSVAFMRGLRRGAELHIAFQGGNEPAWTGGLRGSSAMTDAFNTCRRRFGTQVSTPTQPFAPPLSAAPAQPATPTQPFAPPAAAPAQPAIPAPPPKP